MNTAQTIALVCSIVLCIIGVATFISGMLSRARKDGQLEYKVDSALKGIEEIKEKLTHAGEWQDEIALKVKGHDEKITTLFNTCEKLETRVSDLERSNYGKA